MEVQIIKTITPLSLENNQKEEKKEEPIEFIVKEELGKGSFGTCYIYETKKDHVKYAAKLVEKKKLEKQKAKQSIINEIAIQKSLNHPKIVKIKIYSEDPENVYIIQELCKNRSLDDLLKDRKNKNLSEFEVQSYMFQLIQGVKYLHDRNIIHRDLKPSNIFLDEKLELKIGDFGLIANLEKDKDRRKTCCGTKFFMAPEVIDPGEKGYSFEVDIWSMGVIMYKLLTGKYPFYNQDVNKLEKQILNADFKFPNEPYISDVAKDLIKQILEINPKKRPALNQILYHDFFHMNIFPKYPDIKFLKIEPTLEEKREYMPDMDDDGKIYKEVKNKTLYKLIVKNISEVKYEDIKEYELNKIDMNNQIENWITYIHESRYGFYYYVLNNGLIGIMYKNNNNEKEYNGIKLIFNSDTDTLYEIIKDEKDEDKDIINSYEAQNCPEHLKDKFKDFIKYHVRITQRLNSIENKKEAYNVNYGINQNNENIINNISSISTSNSIQNEIQ